MHHGKGIAANAAIFMFHKRLNHALNSGALVFPPEGQILVLGPTSQHDLSALPLDRVEIYSRYYPDHLYWSERGYVVHSDLPLDGFACAVVCTPRAKALGQSWLHAAGHATTAGLVILDGQKTDGVESLVKALKPRSEILGTVSKAHGKLVWLTGLDAPDWAAQDKILDGGFVTRPGVFSAEKIDKGSAVLASAMPPEINGRVADLGAGWGYLARHILERQGVTHLDLIEADKVALDCAQSNIDDARAGFVWGDATTHNPESAYDVVISNPPFHTGRAGDPDLGRAFIAAAARMLSPKGRFVMVANRHLPYEDCLRAHFHHIEDFGGTSGFKLLSGAKPRRAGR